MIEGIKVKEEPFTAEAVVVDGEFSEADATLTHNFQTVYQELGIDSVVAGMLEDQNQDLGRLSKATAAKAAVDLCSMRKRDMDDMPSPPAKRPRSNGNIAETPVRERMVVGGSPNSSGTDSPALGNKTLYSTPSNPNITPPMTPASKRRGEDGRNGNVAAHATVGRRTTARQAAKAQAAPRTPDSEPDAAGDSPAAAQSADRHARTGLSASFSLSDKERKNQGLRQFSLRVCRQVEAKMTTTYNEVADELVKEFKDDDSVVCDEKNIRRRAYDALNVLTAMDIISKNRKDIQWKGFPHLLGEDGASKPGSNKEREKQRLQAMIEDKKAKIREKRTQVEDLATHYVSLRQLLMRNDRPEYKHAVTKHRINLPFVIVNTDRDDTRYIQIADDKKTAQVTCSQPFELHDDREALKKMNLELQDRISVDELLPPHLARFVRRDLHQGLDSGFSASQSCRESAFLGENDLYSEDDCDANDVEQEEMDDD